MLDFDHFRSEEDVNLKRTASWIKGADSPPDFAGKLKLVEAERVTKMMAH